MMLSDKTIRSLIYSSGLIENMTDPGVQIQPCGVDLTLDYVEEPKRPCSPTIIDFTNKKRKITEMVRSNTFVYEYSTMQLEDGTVLDFSEPIKEVWYELKQGQYIFHTKERVRCPQGISGFMLIRSSLARGGVSCASALIDPGYYGHLTLVVNVGMAPLTIEQGGRFAQVIFFKLDEDAAGVYSGVYKEQDNSGKNKNV